MLVLLQNIHVTEPAAEFVVPGIPRPKVIVFILRGGGGLMQPSRNQ